jgi:hypothetical protein
MCCQRSVRALPLALLIIASYPPFKVFVLCLHLVMSDRVCTGFSLVITDYALDAVEQMMS